MLGCTDGVHGSVTVLAVTIYTWAGGRPGFERWLGRFIDLVGDDELLGSVDA